MHRLPSRLHLVFARVLRELAPFVLGREQVAPEDEAAFRDHARRLTLRGVQTTAVVVFSLAVLAWPFDAVLFPGGSDFGDAMLIWRLGVGGVCFAVALGTVVSPWLADRAYALALFAYTVALGLSGYLAARVGGVDTPMFYGVDTSPVMTVLLVVPFWKRVIATAAITFPFLAAFFAWRPELLTDSLAGAAVAWALASAVTTFVVGYIVTVLLRLIFLQGRALDRRARELEELDRLRNEFFANVSHELRTPLTNILGSLRSVYRSTPQDADRRQIEAGLRNAAHLLGLIDDLLELARMDSGRARPRMHAVDVGALVRRVAAEFESAPGAGLRLTVEGPEPALARVDPRQIRTALANLVGNAFKFSTGAKEPVELALAQDAEALTISVRDHGIGIAPEHQARIFERFYQVEGSAVRRQGGAGIGLSLVREIAALHDGRISLESAPGAGSTFRLRLPRGDVSGGPSPLPWTGDDAEGPPPARVAVAAPSGGAVVSGDPARPLVLVCEDSDDLRDYLAHLLAARYRVVCAADGEAGLALARELAPDLVLADIMMPGRSGTELLAALRGDAALRHTPCVLITALQDLATRVASLEQGANDYVRKPFDEAELLARIQGQLELHRLTRDLAARVALQTRELRELAESLSAVEERERERTARDLHDELGQLLTGLRMHVEWLQSRVEADPPDVVALGPGLVEAGGLVAAVHESLGRVVAALRPGLLEERGFTTAIRQLAQQQARSAGLAAWDVSVAVDEERLSATEAVALYRIVQEALTNVGRHAAAQTVRIALDGDDRATVLRIWDDGRGFDPARPARDGAFGLVGIRERARALGGDCTISSAPGRGAEILVTLPPFARESRDNTPPPAPAPPGVHAP